MKNTTNYNLNKPDGNEFAIIHVLNENADIIDTQLKSLNDNKVDNVSGKQLSTNDYTSVEKTKLAGIATGANNTTVNNTLTSTSTNAALSAAQGKALKDLVDTKASNSDLTELSTFFNAHVKVKWQSALVSTITAVPSNTYVDFIDTQIDITESGLYLFWGFLNLIENTNSNGYREIQILKNGNNVMDTIYQESVKRAGITSYKLPFIGGAYLTAGEKFHLRVLHNNASSLNCTDRMLRVMKVGDNYR